MPMRPVSPLAWTSSSVASGLDWSTPFCTTRIRPGRSVTSNREGDVNARDHGTSSPDAKVETSRTAPERVGYLAVADAGDAVREQPAPIDEAARAAARRRFTGERPAAGPRAP